MKSFNTFFIGGYECADSINHSGNRVDLLADTGHDIHVAEDYRLLAEAGMRTVREGIRWSVVEKTPYQYDFSEVKNRILAAKKAGIQQLWDICHFGYPDDLIPTHPHFADRLTAICKAFTKLYRSCTKDPLIITPVNEISFISWLGGDRMGTVPFMTNSGFHVKYHLCKATIQAIAAIKSLEPEATILMVEPIIRVHPVDGHPMTKNIRHINESQFEAMDIITGRMCPELGGKPEYMDMAGFNYYYGNQWQVGEGGRRYCWKADREFMNFPQVLKDAADRYGKPVVITETGHFKEERALWMELITEDCIEAMDKGVDLRGICIYPVLDRPDWDTAEYIPCGIWGYNKNKKRTVEAEYLACVKKCISKVEEYLEKRVQPIQPTMRMAG